MVIEQLFQEDINRKINGVVKVDQDATDVLVQELDEYVITKDLKKHFITFFNNYGESFHEGTADIGVWISGFFGSGKSHFLKMLSYLLANQEVQGVRTVERFRKKFEDDPATFMLIDSVTNGHTDTILFNIDIEGSINKDKTAVLRVFAKMFYNYLGFYGENLKVAKLEQFIEKRGKTAEFRRVFEEKNGGPWLESRDAFAFFEDDVVDTLKEVLGMSEDAAHNWFNGTETVETSIAQLVSEMKEYVDNKPDDFRLLFMVDEVGQYVGGDTDLLINLQSLVEKIGSECGGKMWVVCTGQEAIDEIIKARENEFSRIQARFKTRLSLTSSSADEVIQKRILKKKPEVEPALEQVYNQNDSVLRNLFSFTDAMDTYYRQYHLAFGKSLTVGNDHLDDLFKQVTDKVEGLYTHWFLGELGNNWSDACADELAQYGRILEVPQQVDFYNQKIKNEDNRVFVIISDAFRYEVAASLAEQLRRETQSKVTLGSCAGIFPTVTKFGMAALLPHKQLSVGERSNGDLQILADGMSTDAGNRDKVLKAANINSVALKYKDIAPMKRAERSALVKGMDVVYIYHDKVDEASHTSDSMVFPACDDAIEEIKNIVRIIRNEFSGTRVYITADHGFLYTYSPLSEDSKVDKTTPSEQDVEIDRRYLITRKGATPDYLLPVKFMDDGYDAFAPRESVRIKKKGGGLNFVHGGISLQEMVVPVIEYHYLRNDSKAYQRNKAKYDTKPVEVGLLSASRKISNMIFSLNFYQKDAVGDNRSAANYLLYFVDSNGKQISDTAKIIADKTSDNGQERTFRCSFNLKSMKYDNRASYYLVIADETGLQMPQKKSFRSTLHLR